MVSMISSESCRTVGKSDIANKGTLISKIVNDPGVRVTYIGMGCNLLIALLKLAGGWAFESDIIVADGWHSITDITSDILTLATVSCGVDDSLGIHTNTWGWLQSVGSLTLSGCLLAGGCLSGFKSATSLGEHLQVGERDATELPISAGTESYSMAPNLSVIWIAVATVVVKEWLYLSTNKVARTQQSPALAANAAHHRMDSLSGVVTLVAVLGATLTANAGWIDHVGGLLISIMTLSTGTKTLLSIVSSRFQ